LPEFKSLFDSWTLAQHVPAMRQLGKRSILDFIKTVGDDHLEIIADHVGDEIKKEILDYNIVKNLNYSLDDVENSLNSQELFPHFCITRNKEEVKVCFWR
jgi:hypothetical protein